jgi:hypothetical protein
VQMLLYKCCCANAEHLRWCPCLQLKVFPDEHTYQDKMKQLLGHGLCTCINR